MSLADFVAYVAAAAAFCALVVIALLALEERLAGRSGVGAESACGRADVGRGVVEPDERALPMGPGDTVRERPSRPGDVMVRSPSGPEGLAYELCEHARQVSRAGVL